MAWQCSGTTNKELVDNLFRCKLIKSPAVKAAMEKVDRAHYCPNPMYAYEDTPQSLGYASTISAPHMHASAVESLLPFLKPGSRVLDVGSGSGYLTAVLAELVGPRGTQNGKEGKVVGLEHIQDLKDLGERNMGKSQRGREFLQRGNVEFVVGDGRKGWSNDASDVEGWDAIHVGAAASELHRELVEQLNAPGRMFIPVEDPSSGHQQHIWVVDKGKDGRLRKEMLHNVMYVPLTDAPN